MDSSSSQFGGCGHTCANSAAPPQQAVGRRPLGHLFLVMDTQGQNMCAGRATHQPTSNGGENIACRNKSLIQGVSKTLPSVPKTKAP
ncbi:hypothetical protein L6164_037857 [Bauhinia variegata]|uniref:Uncharacterized protein n=1 Tax=Bauhinia variegata TaxID=167791 RepID=A0ACB9KLF4_BAUVA|nr:hypothetical protein L6164_037857 [Bauhinia variegata]